jgi:ABC-type multidrug transport system fused ATPase/permease subunit
VLVTALLGVAFADTIGASATGFALAYSLQLTSLVQWAVRQSAEVENCMTSVERMQTYAALPEEGAQIIPGHRPHANWPDKGQIVFDQYQMRYREGLDLVLKGVNVTISGREKVGVCGRTGAGKSRYYIRHPCVIACVFPFICMR